MSCNTEASHHLMLANYNAHAHLSEEFSDIHLCKNSLFEIAKANTWTMPFFIKATLDVVAHMIQDGNINRAHLLSPFSTGLDVALLQGTASVFYSVNMPPVSRFCVYSCYVCTEHQASTVSALKQVHVKNIVSSPPPLAVPQRRV